MTNPLTYLQTSPGLHDAGSTSAPRIDWREMDARDHFVQFYEKDSSLINSVAGYIGAGLSVGDECIVIATAAHRAALETELDSLGIDRTNVHRRRLLTLDAAETLSLFMRDNAPDPTLFRQSIGRIVEKAGAAGRPIRAFGEMVALLWADGNHAAAIRLEELWNDLAKKHSFALFCAYSMDGFQSETHAHPFGKICSHHTRVIPAESYAALYSLDDRLREISGLQQKARALEVEVERRKQAETALEVRLVEIEGLNARLKRAVTETHHRVKNNLQFISALVEMQKMTDRESVPMSELVRLGQNIQALGVIHDILTVKSREDTETQLASVKAVLEQLLPLLEGTLGNRSITASIEDVALPGKQATAVALIANELVSNAGKHGSESIEISVTTEGSTVCLAVCDDGPGFPDDFDPESYAHTGLDLVENIARLDLGATTSYRNRATGGARVSIIFSHTAAAAP